MKKLLHTFYGFVTAAALLGLVIPVQHAAALNGADFNPGNIMNDALFYNPNTLVSDDVQAFLNAKVPACDTNGTQNSTHWNDAQNRYYTRAQWGSINGNQAPYTCLKDFHQTVGTIAADAYCQTIPGGTNLTAAQIIIQVSQACSINPKVMLVLLQKEQGLVTDEWPWADQYAAATGFGCPDSATSCQQEFSGFFNQVYRASRQFQLYKKVPNVFSYRTSGSFYVAYQVPDVTDCGGTSLYLQNQATANLYNYTPYQPNSAALANLNGLGDRCSAYGNRNFWVYYNNWFGSTQYAQPFAWNIISQEQYADSARTRPFTVGKTSLNPGQKAYLRIRAQNVGLNTWTQSTVRLGTSNPYDRKSPFADTSWIDPTRIKLVESEVRPGNTGTFEYSLTAPSKLGTYREYFNVVAENITWMPDPGLYYLVDVTTPQPLAAGVKTVLGSGETLQLNQHLLTPDTHEAMRLLPDGNLEVLGDFKQIWATNIKGASPARLVMQTDGNLVEYAASNTALWATGTDGNPGSQLRMQSDGNIVLYNASNQPVWATGTTSTPMLDSYVAHTMTAGTMLRDQMLKTADNNYRFILQADGNLVLYDASSHALWATGTDGRGAVRLVFQADGNLVLYDGNYKVLWASGTDGKGAVNMIMQQDGNLVMYSNNFRPVWATHTSR